MLIRLILIFTFLENFVVQSPIHQHKESPIIKKVVYNNEGVPLNKNSPVWIIFAESFSDQFLISIGKKVIVNKEFYTKKSIGIALPQVYIPESYLNKKTVICVKKIFKKKIISTLLIPYRKGYSVIVIKRKDQDWVVTYSNEALQLE